MLPARNHMRQFIHPRHLLPSPSLHIRNSHSSSNVLGAPMAPKNSPLRYTTPPSHRKTLPAPPRTNNINRTIPTRRAPLQRTPCPLRRRSPTARHSTHVTDYPARAVHRVVAAAARPMVIIINSSSSSSISRTSPPVRSMAPRQTSTTDKGGNIKVVSSGWMGTATGILNRTSL